MAGRRRARTDRSPRCRGRPAAKEKVLRLIDELGFDPIDAGTLAESWRQQPGTPVYATDLDADGVRKGLAAASQVRPAELRG